MTEDKREIIEALTKTLKFTRAGQNIEKIDYEKNVGGEYAVIHFKYSEHESVQRVNITADSGIAIIKDIARALV